MALQSGHDFAFHPHTTYVGLAGVGHGCLLCTRRFVLMVPLSVTETVWNSHITEKRYSLGGRPVDRFLSELVSMDDMTIDALEQLMQDVADKVEGAALGDLSEKKRLKVRSGMLTKGLYYNEKESGMGGWVGYPITGKEHLQAFLDLYAGSEILVKK